MTVKSRIMAALLAMAASLGLVFTTAAPASAVSAGSTTCSKSRVVYLKSDVGAHSYCDHSITGNRANGSYSYWDKSWGKTTARAYRTSVSGAYKGSGHVYSSGTYHGATMGCAS